jgi:hypothetical protein
MITTLAAFSLILQAQAADSSVIFPLAPVVDTAPLVKDSNLFKYSTKLTSTFNEGPMWDKLTVPELKPNATKLRVLLFVAERDFSNPEKANTLEMRDKQRLIASMSRIHALYQILSEGEIDVEVIPRFIPDPFYSTSEITSFVSHEFNQAKFETDDSVERGPFAAAVYLSGSPQSTIVTTPESRNASDAVRFLPLGFHALGGAKSGMTFEQNLMNELNVSLHDALSERIPDLRKENPIKDQLTHLSSYANLFRGTYRSLLDIQRTSDLALVNGWLSNPPLKSSFDGTSSVDLRTVASPVDIKRIGDEMQYTELSITRAGGVFLPSLDSQASTLIFDVKTSTSNPIAIHFTGSKDWASETVLSDGIDVRPSSRETLNGTVNIKADGSWQTVKLALPKGVKDVSMYIAPPSSLQGVNRKRDELVVYNFRNFSVSNDAATELRQSEVIKLETGDELTQAISSFDLLLKRRALIEVVQDEKKRFASLRPLLVALARDIDPIISRNAVLAYGKLGVDVNAPEQIAFIRGLLSTAPTEYSREAALIVCSENPSIATFETVAPNAVRKNWRTRLAAVKALAALEKTDLKAKPAARQLLLSCSGQDMGVIRAAALDALSANVDFERKRLEFSLVNDPSEVNRLLCLSKLALAADSKTLVNGAFADESPFVRMNIPKVLGTSSPYYRTALQKLVIDADFAVRAHAISLFGDIPDAKPEEFENLFQDEHPWVQLALLKAAKRANWKLPAALIDKLKRSPSKSIRDLSAGSQ